MQGLLQRAQASENQPPGKAADALCYTTILGLDKGAKMSSDTFNKITKAIIDAFEEGYRAGATTERAACAEVCDTNNAPYLAALIRERGEPK